HTRSKRDWSSDVCSSDLLIWDPKRAEVLLVEQFRVGALADERSPWCLEVVAGIADQEGEPFAELIEREAKEEANIALRQLLPLPSYFVSPGGTNERMHLFLRSEEHTSEL